MNIKQFEQSDVIRFDGELKGEKYWIETQGSSLTPTFRNAINKNVSDPLLLAKELSERITNWNLWREKEGDLTPDFETISRFPDEIVYSLVETISQAWKADEKKQQASATGS